MIWKGREGLIYGTRGTEENHKKHAMTARNLNRGPSEYEARVLTTRRRLSV